MCNTFNYDIINENFDGTYSVFQSTHCVLNNFQINMDMEFENKTVENLVCV